MGSFVPVNIEMLRSQVSNMHIVVLLKGSFILPYYRFIQSLNRSLRYKVISSDAVSARYRIHSLLVAACRWFCFYAPHIWPSSHVFPQSVLSLNVILWTINEFPHWYRNVWPSGLHASWVPLHEFCQCTSKRVNSQKIYQRIAHGWKVKQ